MLKKYQCKLLYAIEFMIKTTNPNCKIKTTMMKKGFQKVYDLLKLVSKAQKMLWKGKRKKLGSRSNFGQILMNYVRCYWMLHDVIGCLVLLQDCIREWFEGSRGDLKVGKGCRRLDKSVEDLAKLRSPQDPILHKGKKKTNSLQRFSNVIFYVKTVQRNEWEWKEVVKENGGYAMQMMLLFLESQYISPAHKIVIQLAKHHDLNTAKSTQLQETKMQMKG